MANNISIVVSVQNKATQPLKKVGQEVKNLQSGLKDFNRDLFATTALIGTFAFGFSKALESAKIGAQYDYMRNQFYSLFDAKYFRTLMAASRGTVDAMSLMQGAVQAYTTGLNKEQVRMAMGISVFAAKRTGKATSEAFKELITGLNSGRLELSKFLGPSLKFNDSLMMMNKAIGTAGQGWIGAGAKGKAFRNTLLQVLYTQSQLERDTSEGYLEALMRTGAAFKSNTQIVGDFITRAMAPAVTFVGTRLWSAFYQLDEIIGAADKKTLNIRNGLVDLIKVVGASLGTLTAMWGSFKILTMFLGTAGMTLKGLIGLVTLAGMAFKTAYGESESFRQFIANVGTGFMFLYEAMKTWHEGTVTITGDVYARFKKLSPETQDFLHNFVEGLGLIKEAILGAAQSFKFLFDMISKTLKVFGLWDGKTNKIGHGWLTAARGVGMVGGAVAMGYAMKQILPGLRSLPLIGRLFGGGQPGSNPSNPMYTKEVGMFGGGAGEAAKAGILRKAMDIFSRGWTKGRSGWMERNDMYGATAGGFGREIMQKLFPTFTGMFRWFSGRMGRLGTVAGRMGASATSRVGEMAAGASMTALRNMASSVTAAFAGGMLVPIILLTLAAMAGIGIGMILNKLGASDWLANKFMSWSGKDKTGEEPSLVAKVSTAKYEDPSTKKTFSDLLQANKVYSGGADKGTMDIVAAIMENSKVTQEESQGLAKYLRDIHSGMSPDQASASFKAFTLGHH